MAVKFLTIFGSAFLISALVMTIISVSKAKFPKTIWHEPKIICYLFLGWAIIEEFFKIAGVLQ